MVNSKWGIKRTCNNCATKFYDLLKENIVCPNCGAVFNTVSQSKIKPSNKVIKNLKVKNESIESDDGEEKLNSLLETNEIETHNETDNLNIDEEIINNDVDSIGSDEMDDILIDDEGDNTAIDIDIKTEDQDEVEK